MRLVCLLLLLLSLPLSAAVYRYVDENGVVHYTDKPQKGAQAVEVPAPQTMPSLPVPPPAETGPAGTAPADPAQADVPRYRLELLSPPPEATYRDPGGSVTLAASVSPALAPGHGLVFHVDGTAVAGPGTATSHTVTGLLRGSHQLAVAVVGPDGRELARSSTVTVHIKPPMARPPALPQRR